MPSHSELVTAVSATSPALYYPLNSGVDGGSTSTVLTRTFSNIGTLGSNATNDLSVTVGSSGPLSNGGLLIPGDNTGYMTVTGSTSVRFQTGVVGSVLNCPLPDFTYQVIFKAASGSGTLDALHGWVLGTLSSSGETSQTNYQFSIGLLADYSLQLFWESGSGSNQQVFGSYGNAMVASMIGNVRHLVVVKQSSLRIIRVYINAIPVCYIDYSALSEVSGGASSVFALGSLVDVNSNSLAGTYGHPAVWTRALSSAEIASLYTASGVSFYTPTAGGLSIPVTSSTDLSNFITSHEPIANKMVPAGLDGLSLAGARNVADDYYWSPE